jgi:hypothetical protein
MDTTIKLDGDAIHAMLQASVLEQLTPEIKEQLITKAVQHLLRERVHKGHDAPTQLQQIFNEAVRRQAEELMGKELEKPEVLAKFRSIVEEAVTAALTPEGDARNKIVATMTNAIRLAVTGERY